MRTVPPRIPGFHLRVTSNSPNRFAGMTTLPVAPPTWRTPSRWSQLSFDSATKLFRVNAPGQRTSKRKNRLLSVASGSVTVKSVPVFSTSLVTGSQVAEDARLVEEHSV